MSRITCLSRLRACFESEAAHALPPASSASFARDRFLTSFGPEAPRLDSAVTRASSAMSRQSIEANVAAAGSLSQSPPGSVVVVVGAWVVVVEVEVVAVGDVGVVVLEVVVLDVASIVDVVVVDVVVLWVVVVLVDVVVVVVDVVVDVVVVVVAGSPPSYAPMSQRVPTGRVVPFWSVASQAPLPEPGTAGLPWSTAGLPSMSLWVAVVPPLLSASGKRPGAIPVTFVVVSPAIVQLVVLPIRSWPPDVSVPPPQSVVDPVFPATIVLLVVTSPAIPPTPPGVATFSVTVQFCSVTRPFERMPPPPLAAVLWLIVLFTSVSLPRFWKRPPPVPAWLSLNVLRMMVADGTFGSMLKSPIHRPPPLPPTVVLLLLTVVFVICTDPWSPWKTPPPCGAVFPSITLSVIASVPKFAIPPPSRAEVLFFSTTSVRVTLLPIGSVGPVTAFPFMIPAPDANTKPTISVVAFRIVTPLIPTTSVPERAGST